MKFLLLGPPTVLVRSASDPAWQARAVGPKSTALLAYLALAPAGGLVRRDSLVALLWPESSHEDARAALRQLLSSLRRSVGRSVIRTEGQECVGLGPGSTWCDVWAFEDHLERGELRAALELYRGEFLEGLHVSGCPQLEPWLHAQRLRYRDEACEVAWALTRRLCSKGELRSAVSTARTAIELKPLNEPGVRQLLRLMATAGDSVGALREYRAFRGRMHDEMNLRPHETTEALVDAIRNGQARLDPETLFDDAARPG